MIPFPSVNIVLCVKPLGMLCTSPLIPCDHHAVAVEAADDDEGGGGERSVKLVEQPISRVGDGTVPLR